MDETMAGRPTGESARRWLATDPLHGLLLPSPLLIALLCTPALTAMLPAQSLPAPVLPDAPSALLAGAGPGDVPKPDAAPLQKLPPCPENHFQESPEAGSSYAAEEQLQRPCREENPLQPIISSEHVKPLTVRDKGVLAFRDIIDPFNLITIAGTAAVSTAASPHSAFGPGFKGFGWQTGYALSEDIIGETLSTFAVPSLVHEDPRYHRMPGQPFGRRLLHAVLHTYVSQHDDGRLMPNYAILGTYPMCAEIFNLYVPGVATDAPSTAERIGIGIATNPAGDIVAEFLPDIAKRVHVRIVFVQQIMNQVALGAPGVQ